MAFLYRRECESIVRALIMCDQNTEWHPESHEMQIIVQVFGSFLRRANEVGTLTSEANGS